MMRLDEKAREDFNEAIQLGIDMKAFQPEKEVEDQLKGRPARYSPLNYAFSGKTLSTPCRPVINLSAKVGMGDVSPNEAMLRGPKGNQLASALLFLRAHRYSATTDLSKAYWRICLTPVSWAVRRVILAMRDGKVAFGSKDPEYVPYILRHAMFGDMAAAALLTLICVAAAICFCRTPVAREQVTQKAYADDLQASSMSAKGRDQIMRDIDRMCRKSSWPTHEWVILDPPPAMPLVAPSVDELKNYPRIFGYILHQPSDNFILNVIFNLSPKKRGRFTGEPLLPGMDVPKYLEPYDVTKRTLASIAMALWDVSGNLILAQVKLRFLYRSVLLAEEVVRGKSLDWDDSISTVGRERFCKALES